MDTEDKDFGVTVRVWRQAGPAEPGRMVPYKVGGLTPDMSLLEMLDRLNENLMKKGESPIVFDSGCREGVCGSCGVVVNGDVHGPEEHSTVCQLRMRRFKNGDVITLEPWRVKAFPVIADLSVDRSALDRITGAGGWVSADTGAAPEANAVAAAEARAAEALDAAGCIGCGACAAACPNGSAALFTAAKISHLALLPQGAPERAARALALACAMDKEGLGGCCGERECEAVCPKGIKIAHIARMNREFLLAGLASPLKR